MASSDYNRLIEHYGYDVQAGLVVSQFEYADTFMVRDKIEIDQNKLTVAKKESLRKYDAILLKRAKEFAKY
ncbi:MAG: hypothetical protein QME63_08545 [Actinomycetota bacterium]|nr:hypothetical protein [Actinomycetota bacterium]